jgi:2-phosphoglycerate kinase
LYLGLLKARRTSSKYLPYLPPAKKPKEEKSKEKNKSIDILVRKASNVNKARRKMLEKVNNQVPVEIEMENLA